MKYTRQFGLLMHPTSLPGRYGIGEIGWAAERFLSILKDMGAAAWQMLPLNPTSVGNSPYSALSAFAGNPLLICMDALCDLGLLQENDLEPLSLPDHRVDYDAVQVYKNRLFRKAFDQFDRSKGHHSNTYKAFEHDNAFWLTDYAAFCVLKERHHHSSWHQWADPYKHRDASALNQLKTDYSDSFRFHCFLQYLFYSQWNKLHASARHQGVTLIGDMPIFVAFDSADVWSRPDDFDLDPQMNPVNVAGVPPDYFSPTGQKWGNPLYRWDKMKQNRFSWWVDRFKFLFSQFDVIRIDHFRGFEQHWSIPAEALTAETGEWKPGPGREFFDHLSDCIGPLSVIAEDLGIITPEVEVLRDTFHFPGMRILQFAFGGDASNPYLPFHHRAQDVVYTGTHDNDTITGWWESLEADARRTIADQIAILQGHPVSDIHQDMIRMAFHSVCHLAIFPVQDILGLASSARMNIPGVAAGNWEWRMTSFSALQKHTDTLRWLASRFDRINSPSR